MKIAMVSGEFPPTAGGVGSYVYNLSKNLISLGNEVSVFTRGDCKSSKTSNVEGIEVHRVTFFPFYPFHIQIHGLFLSKEFRVLEDEFDVVHFHSPIIPPITTNKPTIVTEHGTVKGFIDNLELTDLFSFTQKMFSPMYVSIDKKVLTNAKIVTTVSQNSADELQRYYGIRKDISVVYNGVDTDFFRPGNLKKESNYVLYTGALVSKKGVIDLIKAAKYVIQKVPDIHFVITGKGPLEKTLRNLSKQLKIEKNVFFKGFVSRNELLKYYQNALMYIFPSYYEGLPTVILEAMACGVPVVATNIKSNSEVITNGKTGLLVEKKNPKVLAESILSLIENQELREYLGNNGRHLIMKKYAWRIISNRFLEIYRTIVRTS